MKTLLLALALALLPHATLAKGKKAAKSGSDSYKVDTAASSATWEGRKLAGNHDGTLKFKDGTLTMKDGALTGGTLTIDMTSLQNNDQKGDLNAKLVNHLKSDDFFSVEKNPTSVLKIKKVAKEGDKTMVTGDLTIKGITKPITFPVDVKVEGDKVHATADMKVDRTQYDIKFRSLKFFSSIGDKVIYDDFNVKADITAIK